MATVNEDFFDALVRHQIGLLRVSGSIRLELLQILDATEADIKGKILSRLDGMIPGATDRNLERAAVLNAAITKIRAGAWDEFGAKIMDSMLEVAQAEPDFMQHAVRSVAPVSIDLVIPDAALLQALVEQRPFEGRILSDWASGIADADIQRMTDAVRLGMVQGETPAEIAARVVGTVGLNGADGVTEITRNNAASLTRTAVNHFANQARLLTSQANSDIFGKEQFVATLDARTTPICQATDGQIFKTGEGPIPPLHFGCRSTRVPVIDGLALGDRPFKSSTEGILVDEFAAAKGLDAGRTRDSLPHGTKGLFDKFAAKRIRELTGQAPESTTYQVWLGKQTKAFQNDVLGPTRAKLFRDGGLQLTRFVNRRGDEIPLSVLRQREKAAFKKAGLL